MSKLSVGTKVIVRCHVGRDTWHLSNSTDGKEGTRYEGRIVGYDGTGFYLVKITAKGMDRIQRVRG
jgi:hypothetical protein